MLPIERGIKPFSIRTEVIRLPSEPENEMANVSRHVSPRLNSMLSPGEKDETFTLAMVFQALPGEVPGLESFPPDWST